MTCCSLSGVGACRLWHSFGTYAGKASHLRTRPEEVVGVVAIRCRRVGKQAPMCSETVAGDNDDHDDVYDDDYGAEAVPVISFVRVLYLEYIRLARR